MVAGEAVLRSAVVNPLAALPFGIWQRHPVITKDARVEEFKGIVYNKMKDYTRGEYLSVPSEDQIALVRYRLEKARQCAATAKNILFDGDYNASVDRSCFAIFHGMRALLVLNGLDLREGAAVTAKFTELYIATGIFNERFSQIIKKVFDLRIACDYDDFFCGFQAGGGTEGGKRLRFSGWG